MNERVFAENCLREKDLGKKPYYSLHLIARYYYSLGYRKKKIIEELTRFLENYYPPYNNARYEWDNQIEKIAKNAGKTPLFESEGVKITSAELEKIESLNNKVLERLAFTLLCLAKLKLQKNPESNGWITNDAKEIFTLARISCKEIERYLKINKLYTLGFVEPSKKITNLSIRVTYINDDSPQKLFISDFRELGYEYLQYKGEKFIRCQECGVLTRANKNGTKKYCKNCAGYKPQKTKIVSCVDCGKEFVVNSYNSKTCRCKDCQRIKNKQNATIRKQNQRKRDKMSR